MELLPRIRDELAFEGNIRKSYLYRFLMNFQLWWPIWVIYLLRERHLSFTQITLLDTPFFILIVLAEIPTGAVADRFGRRTSLMFASTLFAVAVFVFGMAQNYAVILVSYTAWGLAQTFQSGADAAILYDSLKQIGREDDFQEINGRLWAITSFAVLIAMLIGAPLVFLQPFLTRHGVGISSLGWWQAPVRAAGILSALGTARWIARVGQRGAFLAMPLALGGCYLALAGIDHAWVYVAFLPCGMVAGMQNPVLATYINRRIPSARRATILSVQSVIGSMMLATMEPTAGFVTDHLGLRAMFLLQAAIVLGTAPLVLWVWNRVETGDITLPDPEAEPVREPVAVS